MMFVETWGDAINRAFQGVLYGVASFLPTLIVALVVFAVGWVVAALIEKLIEAIFRSAKVDNLFRAAGMEDAVKRAGYNLNTGRFVGTLVKWFIIAIFLVAVCDVLGLTQVNTFLSIVVLGYLPRIIIAVLVLMVAAILGNAAQKFIAASARAAHVGHANFLGSVAKWAIWIFAILTALDYLNIAGQFLQMLFIGIVVAIALSVGLAFGLGGRDAAAQIISKLTRDVSETR